MAKNTAAGNHSVEANTLTTAAATAAPNDAISEIDLSVLTHF